MADVYTYTFIIIGILLSWPALLLALNFLLPAATTRIQIRMAQSPRRAFLVGLPVTAVFILLITTAIGAGSGLIQGFGYLLVGLLLALWLLGGAGITRLMGQRMGALSNQSELYNLTRGTAVFVLASLCPIIGWFLFLPITTVLVIGAAALSWRQPRPQTATISTSTVQQN